MSDNMSYEGGQSRLEIIENDIEDLKINVNLVKFLLMNQYLDSNKNFCPVCGNISEFYSFGRPLRKNIRCPHCKSVERHRLVYLLFQQRYSRIFRSKSVRLLHFAPENLFYDYFRKFEKIDYYPVDINPESYESRGIQIREQVDMQSIPFHDNKFDVIYASHVLEHVPDDIKAMSELYRVLKYGGSCVLLVPISSSIKETLEKEEYNTPELRKKYYGQANHLRRYSIDVKERLESVGFKVDSLTYKDFIDSDIEKKFYKLGRDIIFLCKKE